MCITATPADTAGSKRGFQRRGADVLQAPGGRQSVFRSETQKVTVWVNMLALELTQAGKQDRSLGYRFLL